ncbi:MAG: TonB-dependent receptor [Parahaliea sp.]
MKTVAQWNIADSASLKFAYEHNKWDDNRSLAGSTDNTIGEPIPVQFGVGITFHDRRRVALDQPARFGAESDGYFLTGNFDLGWADLVSYTMYREEETYTYMDLDGSAAIEPNLPWWAVVFDTENDSFSQEFNLSGNYNDRLDWIIGFFYYEFNDTFNSLSSQIPAFGFVNATDVYDEINSEITAWATFVDLTYEINQKWSVAFGIRYGEEKGEGTLKVAAGNLLTIFPPPIAPGTYKEDDTWESTTPRAVLRYQINDSSNLYLSYSEGYKAGLLPVSDTRVRLGTIKPESIKAWEIGYKYSGEMLRMSAAAFSYDYTDLQVSSYIGTASLTTNAATSTIWGVEFQADAVLNDNWSVNFGIGYTDSEYDKYLTAPHWSVDLGNAQFVPLAGDASGNQMQRTPEVTANLGVQYETSLAQGTLRAGGNYYYTSKIYFDPANQFEQDAYGLLNATLSWSTADEKWTFSLFGTNLTDEEYVAQVLSGPPAILETWGQPRSYGASIGYEF